MNTDTLRTSADDLYELVKEKKKISIDEAAKLLKLPLPVVHSLVDFLVEERIFGIEYKFTTPYIYVSRELHSGSKAGKPLLSKEDFFLKAQQRNLPTERVHELWNKYVEENTVQFKVQFYEASKKKGIPQEQIDQLWERYVAYLR